MVDMTDTITNLLSIHFDTDAHSHFDVIQYMLDIGISNYVIGEQNGWFIVKINEILKMDSETRIKHNEDFSIIFEYEILI